MLHRKFKLNFSHVHINILNLTFKNAFNIALGFVEMESLSQKYAFEIKYLFFIKEHFCGTTIMSS